MPTPTAYFQGAFMPLEDAKIPVNTHAFMYGTAVFEGIRGNWNAEQEQLYIFRLADHVRRLRQNGRDRVVETHALPTGPSEMRGAQGLG